MTLMQFDSNGRLRHLLTLEGLSRDTLLQLLDCAAQNCALGVDPMGKRNVLAGMAVCTLFFEPSTRTRHSFHLAAQRLGADVLNFDASMSSTSKGESACDTLKNLEAMGVRGFIVRHPEEIVIAQLAAVVGEGTVLINAGAGRSTHPTQALLDMLTLCQAKGNDFSKLKLLFVGDIKHSRVARSNLHALRTLGAGQIRVCGPTALLPHDGLLSGCVVSQDFDAMLEGVDVLMMLRLQRERMEEGLVPSLEHYHANYGLTAARLARAAPDAVVLHPGPINRGVEITDEVADGPQSWILRQASNGVMVRMAVLETLLGCA
ncbi:aspartate carbamoyltransferase catalytic subunit [Xylella fastidiosa]|uniref:aspartate carbamoyltransferase catalytic subunit n=1 Tax=Xylella fastidiosa TaxID=2371 RepID=UPI0004CF736A|nr:aspartate carbamoyltransferase catalytic subunit [Xylella fastidiosa]ALQ95937.1 aspartate carbamoyltransferase catalytic subunit [Xylella fastidiosa]ALQ98140.1 aspartate carbamoyltransferase catalytic subunit [Xylella fastidiosa]ALR03079.1 aspartate carbamoyltransferase catalytic subunit [Xylella fastidiosa]ALR05308.1 aspartate carbamoyltransferase catalytic subunit [Xylella fastidiosa]ALR09952.2 aspartate carbamoyltransferase [Xylella fastidiosa]